MIFCSKISSLPTYQMSYAQNAHKNNILASAKRILSNPESLRAHLYKSKPCPYANNCDRADCGDAHFLEEFRIPICLYLEFCQKRDCKMYHPHMGAPHEYISFMGINRSLLPRQQFEAKKCIIQGAKLLIEDKERLRQHFYRTIPCKYGEKCLEKETCQNAHFTNEYRLPICPFLNFCEDSSCKNFHPERDVKEKFYPLFKFSSVEEFLKREEEMAPLRPLINRNLKAIPSYFQKDRKKEKTKFCDFVKPKSMCRKAGCSYAHSLEELVIGCDSFTSLEEKKAFVEATTGKSVPYYYLRPAYKNSDERRREHEELKFVMMMRAEENGEEYTEPEEPEESKYEEEIEQQMAEVLQEIEIETHQAEFSAEMEEMEMEEFDDSLYIEEFRWDQDGKRL